MEYIKVHGSNGNPVNFSDHDISAGEVLQVIEEVSGRDISGIVYDRNLVQRKVIGSPLRTFDKWEIKDGNKSHEVLNGREQILLSDIYYGGKVELSDEDIDNIRRQYKMVTIKINGHDFRCRVDSVEWSGLGNGDDSIITLNSSWGDNEGISGVSPKFKLRITLDNNVITLLNSKLDLNDPTFDNKTRSRISNTRDYFRRIMVKN